MKKLLCLLLCLAMAISLFSACGSTATKTAPEESNNTPAEENEKIILATEADTTDVTVKRGGTLVLAKAKAMSTGLDLTRTDDSSSHYTVLAQIYESLLTLDESGNATPKLATEWKIADDGLSITLKLREDVSFSNGEKFNADAVAKCLNYYLTDECNHYYRPTDLATFESAEALDEYTVRINLLSTDAALELKLSGSVGFIMAPSSIDNKDYATNPVGTGPFVLEEYREGEYVTVTANPNYYEMGEDGQPLPYLDRIKYIMISDDTTQLTNLKSGDVDGIDRHASVSSVISAQKLDGVSIYQNPLTQIYNIAANMSDPTVGTNLALREAIAYATNPQEILDIALEGYGEYVPFWSTPSRWFYDEYNPYYYDLDKAKEKIAEAGYAGGLDLEMAVIAREPDNTMAQLIQSQLAEIGINITINSMDAGSWVTYCQQEAKHQISLMMSGNAGYHPSRQWPSHFARMGNCAEMDEMYALLKQAQTETDQSEGYKLIDQVQHIYMDNCMGTTIGNKYFYGSFRNTVHNVKFNYYGWLEFGNVWMDA